MQVKSFEWWDRDWEHPIVGEWPQLSFKEARERLAEQLDFFSDDEIQDGICVSLNYVDSRTGDQETIGLMTDNMLPDAALQAILNANRPFELFLETACEPA